MIFIFHQSYSWNRKGNPVMSKACSASLHQKSWRLTLLHKDENQSCYWLIFASSSTGSIHNFWWDFLNMPSILWRVCDKIKNWIGKIVIKLKSCKILWNFSPFSTYFFISLVTFYSSLLRIYYLPVVIKVGNTWEIYFDCWVLILTQKFGHTKLEVRLNVIPEFPF